MNNGIIIGCSRFIPDGNEIKLYDFSNVRNIIDIGGGYGVLMTAILKAKPNLSGCILDLPFVLKNTKAFIKDENLEQRCNNNKV